MFLFKKSQDIPRASHVGEHVPNVGFVAPCAALVYASLLAELLVALPSERMPVADDYVSLA